MKFKLAVLPGDGVGPEVLDEGIKALETVGKKFGHSFELTHGLIGGVAIDGKTVRRSHRLGQGAIHLVSAYCGALRVSLGQVKTEAKSNEITAIPELLEALLLSQNKGRRAGVPARNLLRCVTAVKRSVADHREYGSV